MLRCINGLEPVDSGQIRFDGSPSRPPAGDLRHPRPDRHGLPAVQPVPAHDRHREHHARPLEVGSLERKTARAQALELLERVGIPDKADEYPADLSGGQQQRVAIARALAVRPKLMLFDEPTSALDLMIREVLDVMRDLREGGMTMIVVTHEMGFAREVGPDRLHRRGADRRGGHPDEFFNHTRSDRAKEFVDKIIHH